MPQWHRHNQLITTVWRTFYEDQVWRSCLSRDPPCPTKSAIWQAGLASLMGVNLRDLFEQHPLEDGWLQGKRVAVDGHNTAFRYLTSIRAKNGDMLRSDEGRVTSHLYGFLGLVRYMRERGAEPIIIWDGPVHPRKQATVNERIEKRLAAQEAADAALAAGDHVTYQRAMRAATWFDSDMIKDCSRLLEVVGVSVVNADHDGERFGAAMVRDGHADCVATEDFDALVAGAPRIVRKAGSPNSFMHRIEDLHAHNLTVEQLRHVAILCGTDWHPGVKGFGAKTAVKALLQHSAFDLVKEAEGGSTATRFHKLIGASGLTLEEFTQLDEFIAKLPQTTAPPQLKPCPQEATDLADELGVGRDRVVACFC